MNQQQFDETMTRLEQAYVDLEKAEGELHALELKNEMHGREGELLIAAFDRSWLNDKEGMEYKIALRADPDIGPWGREDDAQDEAMYKKKQQEIRHLMTLTYTLGLRLSFATVVPGGSPVTNRRYPESRT